MTRILTHPAFESEDEDELFGDLGDLHFGPEEFGCDVMLARVYIDESSDSLAMDVYVAAGFFAPDGYWTDLRRKWRLQLQASAVAHGLKRLDYFSSKDCRNLRGPFFPLRDFGSTTEMKKVALQIRGELEFVITSSDICGIGVAVNMKDFREYNARPDTRANPHWMKNYEDAAFQLTFGVMAETLRQIEADGVGSHVACFVCDDVPKKRIVEASYHRFKSKHADLRKYMRGISHLDDEKHPPLQMSDLMADFAGEMTGQWIYNGQDKSKVMCRIPNNVLQVKCYDRDSMDRVLRGDTPFA